MNEMDEEDWMNLMITIAAPGEHGLLGRMVAEQFVLAAIRPSPASHTLMALRATTWRNDS